MIGPTPIIFKVCSDCGAKLSAKRFKSYGVCGPCFEKGIKQRLWDSKKETILSDKEMIMIAENESLREQYNNLLIMHESLRESYDKLVQLKLKKIKI